MVTRDVLKVLKLHSPTARATLRLSKHPLMPINHEMLLRSYDANSHGDGTNLPVSRTGHENFSDKARVEKISLASVVRAIYWVEDRDLIKSDGVVISGGWKSSEVSIFENGLNLTETLSPGVSTKQQCNH